MSRKRKKDYKKVLQQIHLKNDYSAGQIWLFCAFVNHSPFSVCKRYQITIKNIYLGVQVNCWWWRNFMWTWSFYIHECGFLKKVDMHILFYGRSFYRRPPPTIGKIIKNAFLFNICLN
jgi:hypothetical protein